MKMRIPTLCLLWFFLEINLFRCEELFPVIKELRNVRRSVPLDVSPDDIRVAFEGAQKKVEERRRIEDQLASNGGIISKDTLSAEVRHQGTGGNYKTIAINTNAEIFEEAAKTLSQRRNLNRDQALFGLPNVQLPQGNSIAMEALDSCRRIFKDINCDTSDYRTADGTCNNLQNRYWGSSMSCLNRILDPDYADSLGSPRVSANGQPLPNPRNLSVNIHNDVDVVDPSITLMVMQWAQFLDHDMTLTPMIRTEDNMEIINCCTVPKNPHPACIEIEVPPDDYFFGSQNKKCMSLVRSSRCNSECSLGPRDQVGILTAFIDGSQIYGSNQEMTNNLRRFYGGQLRMQNDGTLPEEPFSDNKQCTKDTTPFPCFIAGDERVNEQPGLTAMHIIWLKQHNRIAAELAKIDPYLTDEEIFQITRRIIGAQIQHITEHEFLYTVLGTGFLKFFDLEFSRTRTVYDPTLNPSIMLEFSTAAYRFGHTLIKGLFQQLNLSENFFNVNALKNGEASSILSSLAVNTSEDFDRHVVTAVTNNLYKPTGTPSGLDLVAINIQRGRDHGLPGYIHYVQKCYNKVIAKFDDLEEFMERDNWQRLQRYYVDVGDIDLFTGGLNEKKLGGAVVGPTFACIIGLQFHNLKFGDRFFFTHRSGNGTVPLTDSQIYELGKTSLAEIICSNGDLPSIQEEVFKTRTKIVPCKQLTRPDLKVYYRDVKLSK